MADIVSFRALRYDPPHVDVSRAVTQPYDKITPAMQEGYYAASPYNLVRIILGRRGEGDGPGNNVYTRAASDFAKWRREGILRQDESPSIYSYSQRFTAPGSTAELERRGFIAAGRIEDYAARIVHRHEQTLAKPKADRLDLLRATRAHFGQIFMLYEDAGGIDRTMVAAQYKPEVEVQDEYGVVHRVWQIADPKIIGSVREQMRDKKLIIADGHHRYETALNYRNEQRAESGREGGNAPYEYVMMTFVNMNSPGLVVLPTHRVVHGLENFAVESFQQSARAHFDVEEMDSDIDGLRAAELLRERGSSGTALLAVSRDRALLLHRPKSASPLLNTLSPRQQALDVVQLHKCLLEDVLQLSEESIRNQQNLAYLRDANEALERVRANKANIAFLMNPCKMQQVRDIAFAGEVMPQKSTDFYPKLLSGLTVYALE